MSESLERVAGLIEIGAVAIQSGSLMSEVYLTVENGCIGILGLIEVQHIGMHQIHTRILRLGSPARSRTTTLLLLLRKSRHHAQSEGQQQ